jgi:hypothetical protein
MRVAIPHSLDQQTVRERLKARSHEIAEKIPLPGAMVRTDWPSENRMNLSVTAMGQGINGYVDIEPDQLIFDIPLPAALGFIEPMVAGAIRDHGHKLLTKG